MTTRKIFATEITNKGLNIFKIEGKKTNNSLEKWKKTGTYIPQKKSFYTCEKLLRGQNKQGREDRHRVRFCKFRPLYSFDFGTM